MIAFEDYPLPVVFILSLIALAIAIELGHRLGIYIAKEKNFATLEAAMLGLLALMISFTFAMALARFDTRRDAILTEANAIGTAALRARMLPPPHAAESLSLLRSYVQIRLDLPEGQASPEQLDSAIARSNEIQEALWRQAMSAAANNGMLPTSLYIQALNNVIDDQEKRLTALRNRVPNIVLFSLSGVALVTFAFAGYAGTSRERSWRVPVYGTGLIVASVILLIQDIDRPNTGFVLISQQPMIDTARAIAGYSIGVDESAAQKTGP